MRLHRFKTSEAYCTWKPDPLGGFQFLSSSRFGWDIYCGDEYLATAERTTDKGWMLWYPNLPEWYEGDRCPKFRTLLEAANMAKKLKGVNCDA